MNAVTVLVPTVGRSASLRRLLSALAGQRDPGCGWEVVVVDNSATSAVGRVVEGAPPGMAVRVVHEPIPGASHARNRGLGEVRTPLVAMLDDDVAPADDWLRQVLAPFDDPTVDGVGGTVRLDPSARRPGWLDVDLASYLTEQVPEMAGDLGDGDYLLTANAAFRTDVVRAHPFDPRLGPRPGAHLTNDDLDLSRRLLRGGHRLVWQPSAVVTHDLPAERASLSWLLRRVAAQGRSDWLLDADRYRERRPHGLRVAVEDIRLAPTRWRGRATGRVRAVHALADAAHAGGFAWEALRSLWQDHGRAVHGGEDGA